MTIIDDDKIIDLSDLLSKPLISTLEADFYTAQRFVKFITEYDLEEVEEVDGRPFSELPSELQSQLSSESSKPLKLKMVTFVYRQIDPTDRQEKLFRIQVPLISLIPLPLLQIERAEFDFNLRIFSEVDLTSPTGSKGGLKNADELEDDSTTVARSFKGLKARLSPAVGRSDSSELATTIDANMKVKVQMRQADLPGGLAYWMSTFNHATSVNQISTQADDQSSETQVDQGSDSPASDNS